MHIGINRRWYSPGYRYPILEACNELITKGSDTLDNLRQIFYFATYEQERQIEDDAANERIREQWKNHPNIGQRGQQHPAITGGWTDRISYSSKDNTVNIHVDVPAKGISVLVSDLYGRVWNHSALASTGTALNVSIDISKYPMGVYMFTVSDNNGNSTTFKIIK
ncbi:MAG TPA: T9SS type A sorting domain-containing protein [Muribaculaceae bacterium]|nr:T9SS type A sorting domain-containing protein [Muribaculaceae bacterium]